MKLIHRFAYYFGGFAIGIIILLFFVGGSGATCQYDYGPDARVLKSIRLKERVFSKEALLTMRQKNIDTAAISRALNFGDVNFSESVTNLDSCNIYLITYKDSLATLRFNTENCKIKATISNLEVTN